MILPCMIKKVFKKSKKNLKHHKGLLVKKKNEKSILSCGHNIPIPRA